MLARFLFCLISMVLLLPAVSRAAMNPDQYLDSGRAVDTQRVFRELEPADTFELALAFAAREQWVNYLDCLEVLARQATDRSDQGWLARTRSELERFQADMVSQCRGHLDALGKEAAKYDEEALNAALVLIWGSQPPVEVLDKMQRAWTDRAVELLYEWRPLMDRLTAQDIDPWRDKGGEAAGIASLAGRDKAVVCQAPDLDEARQEYERVSTAVDGLDGLGAALDTWQRTAAGLDWSDLERRTDQLYAEAEDLEVKRQLLSQGIAETGVDKSLRLVEEYLRTGPDAALISRNAAALNQALYWHGKAGSILAAHWGGGDGAGWRNGVRAELQAYGLPPADMESRILNAKRMPDGRDLAGAINAVLAFRPQGELQGVLLARGMVQAWKENVDQLAVSYGNARADLAAAGDCLRAKAQAVSAAAREQDDPAPATPATQTPDDSDSLADGSDPAEDFGNIPDDAEVSAADAGPQPMPAHDPTVSDPVSDPASDPQPVFGFTGVGIGTRSNPTSTGYHVFAAGSQLGWSAALCRWSAGSADRTIVDQLGRAGDHVLAAHETSLAPLVAWSNQTSIRAKLKNMADKLLAEKGEANSSYRAQLARTLEAEMGALANGLAVQMVAGDKVAKENCESNYHRLGFHLAAAHQAFLMALDMQRQGADQRLVDEVLQDGRQSLRQARNAVHSLDNVVLATGRCADLSDLGDKLHKLTVQKDPEALVRDAGMLWREAEKRILAVSQGGPSMADPADIKGLWAHDNDPSDTIRFLHKGGSRYVGVTEADGEVLRLTRYGDVYRGEGVFINEDGDGTRVWKPGVVLTVTGANVLLEYEGMTLPMSRIGP